jgi:hypothetical protein
MNVFALKLHAYDPSQFFFLEPKPNKLINGTFVKVIYTSADFTMNGIFIHVPLDNTLSDAIRRLETNILQQYAKQTSNLKPFSIGLSNNQRVPEYAEKKLLNISGVWENESHVGIIYKWIDGSPI